MTVCIDTNGVATRICRTEYSGPSNFSPVSRWELVISINQVPHILDKASRIKSSSSFYCFWFNCDLRLAYCLAFDIHFPLLYFSFQIPKWSWHSQSKTSPSTPFSKVRLPFVWHSVQNVQLKSNPTKMCQVTCNSQYSNIFAHWQLVHFNAGSGNYQDHQFQMRLQI